jgi:hypothetical protein
VVVASTSITKLVAAVAVSLAPLAAVVAVALVDSKWCPTVKNVDVDLSIVTLTFIYKS